MQVKKISALRKFLFFAVFVVLAAVYQFSSFVADLKETTQSGAGAEAIVVLTGGSGRSDVGLKLLRAGRAQVLIISGVHDDADADSIFLNKISRMERISIVLDKDSDTTFENAREVARITTDRGLSSILLVTSRYHMKRAGLIFTNLMPGGVEVRLYPVPDPDFAGGWWRGGGFWTALTEFTKYGYYRVKLVF